MRSTARVSRLAAPVVVFLLAAGAALADERDLVLNGYFEGATSENGVAHQWRPNIHAGAEGAFAVEAEEGGNRVQKIVHANDGAEWVRVSQEPISARPETHYFCRARVKSDCDYSVYVYEFPRDPRKEVKDDYITTCIACGRAEEWRSVSRALFTSKRASHFKISLVTHSRGTAWFDDVQLIPLAERPAVKSAPAGEAPKIDGRLDDPAWKSAARIAPFLLLGGKGSEARPPTAALVTHDERNLYFAFQCEEPDMPNVKAAAKPGELVYNDDCVEVFLDPWGKGEGYYHLGVNSKGVIHSEKRLPGTRDAYPYNLVWYEWPSRRSGRRADWNSGANAAGSVGKGAWSVEIAIPFPEGHMARFGSIWGLNLTRERKAGGEQNSCWAYIDSDTFHQPEKFGKLIFSGGPIPPPEYVDVKPERRRPRVVPTPRHVQWKQDAFTIKGPVRVRAHPEIGDVGRVCLELLITDFKSRNGLSVDVASTPEHAADCILIAKWPPNRQTLRRLEECGAKIPPDGLPPEGYVLAVSRDGIVAVGADARGTLFAVQTLRQLIPRGSRPEVPACSILDWPDTPFRGWHSSSPPSAADIDEFKRYVDRMSMLKYNALMFEVNGKLKYERHPDIARSETPTKQQLRELVDYAKSRQMEVIPQVQTFGHFNYVLNVPKYRHLAENPEGGGGSRWGLWCSCPRNPDTYKLVFDLFDEVIEVFRPRYFHIGHDEILFANFNVCERCMKHQPHENLAYEVNRLHEYLKAKGLRMMMWGDQFLPEHNGRAPWHTAKATDMVPKDIIICDWHYNPTHDFPSIDYFHRHGFTVIACGWYEAMNNWSFTKAALRRRTMGYSGTTWWRVANLWNSPELMTAQVLTSENCWTHGSPEIEELPYVAKDAWWDLYNWRRPTPESVRLFTVDLADHYNQWLCFKKDGAGELWNSPANDLSSLPTGLQVLGGVPFRIGSDEGGARCVAVSNNAKDDLPQKVWQIPVGVTAHSLCFLHASTLRPNPTFHIYERLRHDPRLIGRYVVTYEDHSTETIEIGYRKNIIDWNDRLGAAHAPIVWRGRTADGALIQLGAYEWINPHPGKRVRSVDMIAKESPLRIMLIALSGKTAADK